VFGVVFAIHAAIGALEMSVRSMLLDLGPLFATTASTIGAIIAAHLLLNEAGVSGTVIDISITMVCLVLYFYVVHLVEPGLNRVVWMRMKSQLNIATVR
jgi:hypothetical protein